MTRLPALAVLFALSACRPALLYPDDAYTSDGDSDGVAFGVDCDDTVQTVGAPTRWYADEDADGYGVDDDSVVACDAPEGFVSEAGDCAPTVREIHPGAIQDCSGMDTNCDGQVNDIDSSIATDWHPDRDNDGEGSPTITVTGCAPTESVLWVDNATDCDDDDPDVGSIGRVEVCGDGRDNDCDPTTNCSRLGELDLTNAITSRISGPGLNTRFGTQVIVAGDVDGDGHAELAVGLAGLLVSGLNTGGVAIVDTANRTLTQQALVSGPSVGARFGASIAALGDVDDNGFDDLVVAAPTVGPFEGRVFVLSGPIRSRDLNSDPLVPFAVGSELRGGQVGAADLVGNGVSDIALGTPSFSMSRGGVAVVPADPSDVVDVYTDARVWLQGIANDGAAGSGAILSIGDLDGDGRGELAIAVPAEGAVFIVYGSDSAAVDGDIALGADTTSLQIVELSGFVLGSNLTLASGDVTGDAVPDVVIGDPDAESGDGGVFVVSGATLSTGLIGDVAWRQLVGQSDQGLGQAVAVGRNGDQSFVAVSSTQPSVVYLVDDTALSTLPIESTLASVATASMSGPTDSDFGQALATGDLEGDGADEVIVGAPSEGASGAVFVWWGDTQ